MIYNPVVFISAEVSGSDYYSNVDRTNNLRNDLLVKGYSIVGVKMNNLQGFLVTTDNVEELKKLAVKHNQSDLYISDKSRQTYKVNTLGPENKVILGKLLKKLKRSDSEVTIDSGTQLKISFIEDGTEYTYVTE